MIKPEEIDAIATYPTWQLQSIIPELEYRIKWKIEDLPAIDCRNEIAIAREFGDDEYAAFLTEELQCPPTPLDELIKDYELFIGLAKAELARRGRSASADAYHPPMGPL